MQQLHEQRIRELEAQLQERDVQFQTQQSEQASIVSGMQDTVIRERASRYACFVELIRTHPLVNSIISRQWTAITQFNTRRVFQLFNRWRLAVIEQQVCHFIDPKTVV